MASLRDFLQRFRPAGTPGAAARPGVPADRQAELAVELEPVFALLAETQDQAERLRLAGSRQAAEGLRQAADQAEVIMSNATGQASAVRAEAAARAQALADPQWQQLAAAADRRADQIRAVTRARLPGYVELSVRSVPVLGEDHSTQAVP